MCNLKADEVIEVIGEVHGNLTAVSRKLKVSRPTMYKFVDAHPTVRAALDSARESMIDNVESKLYQKALEGEGWAVCFFLKTQGKRRGYIERQEVTGEDGGPLVVTVKWPDDEKPTG